MRFSIWLLTLSLCCFAPAGCSKQGEEPPATRREADPSRDPLYGGYRFGGAGVVDFGVQPLCMPESSVSELLARDRTLAAALKADNGVLKTFPFYKGKDVHHFMARGDLEVGILGDMPAIAAAAAGDIVVVAMVKQGFTSIVAGRPMLLKELKGKRVATGLGSTAHFTLLTALDSEGLTERDVKLVDMDVNLMPQALARGEIDAFSAWEPTPAAAFQTHPEFYLVHKGLSFGFLCFRRDFAAAHPARVRAVAAAVARSCLWMRRPGTAERVADWTRASASSFHKRPYPLKADAVMALARNDLLNVPTAPLLPERLLRERGLLWREFQFLKKTGNIPEETPWVKVRDSFDTELLRSVLSDSEAHALQEFDYMGENEPEGSK